MWLLDNNTPFAADRTWVRDERGAEHWLVVIRACFDIDPDGRQHASKEQTEVQRAPVFAGDPKNSGLLTDSDFALHKDGTDILIDGRAYAPGGRPSSEMQVRVKVASMDKTLKVVGERRLYKGRLGLAQTQPEPFLEMSLTWERTYGGWDSQGKSEDWVASNPAGVGFATDPSHLYETQAPNVEYTNSPYCSHDSGKPAGFGPIAHHWQPRVKFAGTYNEDWKNKRDPLHPVDFDRRYYQSAPLDQQADKLLAGYEIVQISGMTLDGFLSFVIPHISFNVITKFKNGSNIRQKSYMHTLWLMPTKRHFEIVYLSSLEVPPGREEKLVGTTVSLKKRLNTPPSILRTGVWNYG